MQIEYNNGKIEKLCKDFGVALKKLGQRNAELLAQRLKEIRRAESAAFMVAKRIGRCHDLKGDRKGQYAVDLVHPRRLVFTTVIKDNVIAVIIEVVDYH